MENHRYNGAIHMHYKHAHDRKPKTQELIENSKILHRVQNYHRLAISEAVSIELRKPLLNIQREFDLVLPSCRRKRRENDVIQVDPALPSSALTPADAPQPISEGGQSEGEVTRGGQGGNQRAEEEPPQPTDYVRQRLRPRLHGGETGQTRVHTRTRQGTR